MAGASPERDYAAIAESYARDVCAKRIVAGRWTRLACRRHLDDLKRSRRRAGWDYYYDPDAAWDVCDFVEKLPHVEGVWETPTIRLEAPQVFILAVVFGWRRHSDGLRRFTSVYIEMARKGAKSTLTAGVALYCLCCEDEPGAQIIIGATTGEQAQKVFGPAKQMVERTAALRQAFDVQAWARSITCGSTAGFIQPINAKGKTQDGWNPHVGILDELHAHPNRALFDVVSSAFGSRRNPLRWVITTAGYDTTGVCYEQHLYVRKVLEGALEAEHYFGIIFAPDEGDDVHSERAWRKANPMLGITPTIESMQRDSADAKASPAAEGEFSTKRLNVWMTSTNAWLNVRRWRECGDPSLGWKDFEGLDCWIGGDLADKDDVTALVLCAFDDLDRLLVKPVFWLPEAVLELPEHRENRGAAPYRVWAREGWLQLTPGDWVDHGVVEDQVRAWLERYAVRRVTFDQFSAARAMAAKLCEDYGDVAGFINKRASTVTDPAKELERRVKAGPARLRHDANPVMTWMASNVTVERRRDETLLPVKETKDSKNKIDGIDALIFALEPALQASDDGPSVYETRGLASVEA